MSRPETGPMQFGDDNLGVFIRGDSALALYLLLTRLPVRDWGDTLEIAESIKLLRSCNCGDVTFDESKVQKIKPWEECQ